ncbi:MAG: DNA polymerase III subunit delta [Bacteroidetes bacterium]|nr:DNA polymerase III subunit delta [Bacteroidota bacterium]MDA1119553.1 DNA polymerase III subunit delta [Bacteroidota bacterium]
MRFAEIEGFEDVKERLIKSSGRNHHAQIFYGQNGSPNLSLALAYATYINCESPAREDSCGKCASCIKIDKLIHPDLHLIFPVSSTVKVKASDAISNNFIGEWRSMVLSNAYPSIDDWLSFYGAENKQANISKEESRQIIQKLSLKSFEAKYKVMLIWLPEYMHPASANAILKILEEPSERSIFLLVTNDYQKLLTTITSRCQLVNIRLFKDEEISAFLRKNLGIEKERAMNIASQCGGDICEAKRLAEDKISDSGSLFREWMRLCWNGDFTSLITWADNYQALSKVQQKNLFIYGISLLRNAIISGLKISELVRVNTEDFDFAQKFGNSVDANKIEMITNHLDKAHYHIERNASPKITFLDLSLSIAKVLKS